jgi:hypothetical protein
MKKTQTDMNAARMKHDPDLIVCLVGGREMSGSINEFEAIRLPKGTPIRFTRADGATGEGVIDYSWMCTDCLALKLTDSTTLFLDSDEVVPIKRQRRRRWRV